MKTSEETSATESVMVGDLELVTFIDARTPIEVRKAIAEQLMSEMEKLKDEFTPLTYSKMIARTFHDILEKFGPKTNALLYAGLISESIGRYLFSFWEDYKIQLSPKPGGGFKAVRKLPKGIQTTLLDSKSSKAR